MRVIAPFEITSGNMTNSISEPDASVGEVEWVDPSLPATFGSYTGTHLGSALANDGNIYCVGGAGNVLKINVGAQTVSTFGSYTGVYRVARLANDGNIYCVGNSGVVLKINVGAQTVSTFGSHTGTYYAATLGNDGNIYCVGDTGVILEINVGAQTVSTFGSYTTTYYDSALANDGNIYCVGGSASGVALKISVEDQTASTFGSHQGAYFDMALANNGDIYCVGNTGSVLKIDVSGPSMSTFGSYSTIYRATTLASDGNIYCVGDTGPVLSIDTGAQTVSTFGSYTGTYYETALANDGNIYCVGDTSTVLKLNKSYGLDEEIVKSSSHSKYISATPANLDDPEVGELKTPPTWVNVGSTNKYRAFDYAINTKSEMPVSGAEFTFSPSVDCTNVALFGLEDVTRVYVEARENNASGAIIYSEFQDTEISAPIEDTLANGAFLNSKILFDDLPLYATPFIKITFESSGADIKIGDIVIGNHRTIGTALHESSTSRTSYDTVSTDVFGNEKITRRPSAEYTSFEISIEPIYANYVERILKEALNIPSVWVGDKPDDEKLFTLGYYERSPIVYSSPSKYRTTLKIRGLV